MFRNLAHEIGHSGDLPHVWELTSPHDINQKLMGQVIGGLLSAAEMAGASKRKLKELKKELQKLFSEKLIINLMNSADAAQSPELRTSNPRATELTKGQFEQLERVVTEQQPNPEKKTTMKNYLTPVFLLITSYSFAQIDTALYIQDCLKIRISEVKKRDALDIKADHFLKKDQIFLYFKLKKSDTITILLNDSLVEKKFVSVSPNRTGDYPDFSLKMHKGKKPGVLTLFFENDKTFFRLKVQRKFRIYAVVYHTGVWENCIVVDKQKFYHIL